MTLLFGYSIKNAFARKLTATLTLGGIALVVFVFCAVLMLQLGLRETLVDTGTDGNAMVVRKAATTEISSILFRQASDVVATDPAVARDDQGRPLVAGELLVLISLPKKRTGTEANVTIRGLDDRSLDLRPNVELVDGRWPTFGTSEIVVGEKIAGSFVGAQLGESLRFARRDWTIVGVFSGNGTGLESEIWGDGNQFGQAFQRLIYSSVLFRMTADADFTAMQNRLEGDPRLEVDVYREKEYWRQQSSSFTGFISVLGGVISVVFSLGAIVGAMITMYGSVANRTREIGTLRALGFKRGAILSAFLVESLTIAVVGGLLGVLAANGLQFLEVQTTNFDTFAEVAFTFAISPGIVIAALIFAVVMGFVGGFLPAWQASRLKIITALRGR